MSKDKKNQDTQGKELSEWQETKQEYLQKKAERRGKTRAAEEAHWKKKNKQQSLLLKILKNCQEWQKQNQEYLSKETEEGICKFWEEIGPRVWKTEEKRFGY